MFQFEFLGRRRLREDSPPSRLRLALKFMPIGCDLGGPRRCAGEASGGGGAAGRFPSAPRGPGSLQLLLLRGPPGSGEPLWGWGCILWVLGTFCLAGAPLGDWRAPCHCHRTRLAPTSPQPLPGWVCSPNSSPLLGMQPRGAVMAQRDPNPPAVPGWPGAVGTRALLSCPQFYMVGAGGTQSRCHPGQGDGA